MELVRVNVLVPLPLEISVSQHPIGPDSLCLRSNDIYRNSPILQHKWYFEDFPLAETRHFVWSF